MIRTDYFSGTTTVVTTLKEGDYAVALDDGTPLSIRLERKSLGDLYSCFGFGRERVEAELARLRLYDYRGIIIELTLGVSGERWDRKCGRVKYSQSGIIRRLQQMTPWLRAFGPDVKRSGLGASERQNPSRWGGESGLLSSSQPQNESGGDESCASETKSH